MNKIVKKEYGMMRIGDGLEACIHRTFTNEADDLLYRGAISRDERILLSNAISKALDSFHMSLPGELSMRRPYEDHESDGQAVAMPMMRSAGGFMSKVIDWLGLAKEFDTSEWNGSASQWPSAEAYCSDCLIDTNPSGQKKTKDNCHLPYRKPGSNRINKNALRAMASGGRGIPALKNVPSGEKKKAAAWVVRHWKAAFDRPAPDSMYRMAGMTPPTAGEKSSVMFFKDKDQKWWVVLMYSNKYEDLEGDILSSDAHQKFAEFCQKSGFKPAIVLFHQPRLPDVFWLKAYHQYRNDVEKLQQIVYRVYRDTGAAIAEAEHVSYMNGFAFMVGRVYPEKYGVAERLSKMKDLGNSHVFIATDFNEKDDSGIIVNEYVSFEGTILPRSKAANLLTLTALKEKDMKNLLVKSKDKTSAEMDFLKAALGDEGAEALAKNTKELESNLDGILAFKQITEDEEEEETSEEQETEAKKKEADGAEKAEEKSEDVSEEKTEEKTGEKAEEKSAADSAPADEAVVGKVLELLNLKELQGVIKTLVDNNNALVAKNKELEERLAAVEGKAIELSKSQDEQIAAKYAPISWGIPEFARPSTAKDTEVDNKEAKKIKKDAPKMKESETADDQNMLVSGFWKQLSLQPIQQP